MLPTGGVAANPSQPPSTTAWLSAPRRAPLAQPAIFCKSLKELALHRVFTAISDSRMLKRFFAFLFGKFTWTAPPWLKRSSLWARSHRAISVGSRPPPHSRARRRLVGLALVSGAPETAARRGHRRPDSSHEVGEGSQTGAAQHSFQRLSRSPRTNRQGSSERSPSRAGRGRQVVVDLRCATHLQAEDTIGRPGKNIA